MAEEQQIQGSVVINGQYVKDLSFENPNAPQSLTNKEQPKIDINFDIKINAVQDKVYEVVLSTAAKASVEDKPLFMVEVEYAGLFTVDIADEAEKEKVLMVQCPTILFPYARRVIGDATRDGGFPPLLLNPIDFMGLYAQKKQQDSQANDDKGDDKKKKKDKKVN